VPDMCELERRMRRGAWSERGFLGRRERLDDVLARDRQTLLELGITPEELANKLESLIQATKVWRQPGPARVVPCYEVEVTTYFGFQECPWSGAETCGLAVRPKQVGSADRGLVAEG
jgi:hypothetical protein